MLHNNLFRNLLLGGILVDATAAESAWRSLLLTESYSPMMMWTFVVTIALLLAVAHGRILQPTKTAPKFAHRGGGASQPATEGPLHVFLRTIKEARRHLVAAAVARSVSIFAMYPVDTIKTRIQMEQANALRLTGIYKGVGGSLFGQVPYG